MRSLNFKALSGIQYGIFKIVIPPNSNTFPIGEERVTCRESKLTNSLGKQQHELWTHT